VCKHRSEDYIADMCNGVEQLQLEWTGGLDKSKEALGWTGDLDESKGALEWTGGLNESKGALGWTGGLDSPREHWVWTSGLDRSKGALDLRPHWRCGQVDYTKSCVVHG
jgi:hypothetical protein